MPCTQPRGTHTFDPGSTSACSVTQIISTINAEEDQVDPLDSLMNSDNALAWASQASTLPFFEPDIGGSSSIHQLETSSSVLSLPLSDPAAWRHFLHLCCKAPTIFFSPSSYSRCPYALSALRYWH